MPLIVAAAGGGILDSAQDLENVSRLRLPSGWIRRYCNVSLAPVVAHQPEGNPGLPRKMIDVVQIFEVFVLRSTWFRAAGELASDPAGSFFDREWPITVPATGFFDFPHSTLKLANQPKKGREVCGYTDIKGRFNLLSRHKQRACGKVGKKNRRDPVFLRDV